MIVNDEIVCSQLLHHCAEYLGLLLFINWFADFFNEDLGKEGEIKIKIKCVRCT